MLVTQCVRLFRVIYNYFLLIKCFFHLFTWLDLFSKVNRNDYSLSIYKIIVNLFHCNFRFTTVCSHIVNIKSYLLIVNNLLYLPEYGSLRYSMFYCGILYLYREMYDMDFVYGLENGNVYEAST